MVCFTKSEVPIYFTLTYAAIMGQNTLGFSRGLLKEKPHDNRLYLRGPLLGSQLLLIFEIIFKYLIL